MLIFPHSAISVLCISAEEEVSYLIPINSNLAMSS